MAFSVSTWNINSVRLRLPLVQHFLETHQPDVLCLQETKCPNDAFPSSAFRKLGYEHIAIHGQKGYHGVAIVSRLPLSDDRRKTYCDIDHTRNISAIVEAPGSRRIRIHNFYVPAGGDEPDREINQKFAHKLDFVEEMKLLHAEAEQADGVSSILVGDLNIAPLETDVWSHKQLLKVVSHTPIETESLLAMQKAGAWVDLIRAYIPPEEKIFTWWSYRARDWEAADRGRRLDHVWSSADLLPNLTRINVLREARGWERPSDHVPVTAHFAF
ncbi:exodeoxyribonuclease III [Hoeflea sp. YIM 152468]|uniref:exodeoxyribonuclease III n=1 Tax=Hoeflea sp. YIM 152468 TaxID=3031759 RepID=UPI0023DC5B62|nr:exodeoxyribonuclease III [Hoeflea sp. YIM 152468]MDF1608233.1 exodeoxyribonuclease III [Hoeflea sp. YIM 152468]